MVKIKRLSQLIWSKTELRLLFNAFLIRRNHYTGFENSIKPRFLSFHQGIGELFRPY